MRCSIPVQFWSAIPKLQGEISRRVSTDMGPAVAESPVLALLGPRQAGKATLAQALAVDGNTVRAEATKFVDTSPPVK